MREPLSMVVGSTLTITDRGSFFTPFGCESEIKNTLIEQHFKVFSENLWIIQVSIYFLNINGYDYCTSNFIEVMENYVVWVADNKIGKELLLEIITSLINDVSLSNSIKLKVINALNDDQEK